MQEMQKVAILVYRREQHVKSAKRLLSSYIGGSNMYVYIYSRHYIYIHYIDTIYIHINEAQCEGRHPMT